LTLTNANPHQTIPERGVVRSRKPFKFWLAPNVTNHTSESSQVLST